MSKVDGVFSNKDLPSTSVKQPGATVITYNVLGVSWTGLTTMAASHDWYWSFLLDDLWLLGGELSAHLENFHFNYIHIHKLIYIT